MSDSSVWSSKKDKPKVAEHIFITLLEDGSVERKTVRQSQDCVPETLQFSEYGSPGREWDTVLYVQAGNII